MKTLKFQIFLVSTILLCVLTVLTGISIKRSFETRKLSEEYVIKNKITGHLNTAAGWQAIERGYGATILGGGEGDSSSLFSNFLEMGGKGDSEVIQFDKKIKELLSIRSNKVIEEGLNKWRKGYEVFVSNRPRIASNNISKDEWLDIATLNINNEFILRDTTFAPQMMEENILYLNNVLRPNIARLCEFAGLERALVGNTIASGLPFSDATINRIKHHRSIVDQSLGQVLLLKDLPYTPGQMKQAIEIFEDEFLQRFQLLREDIFFTSERQLEEINNVKEQMAEKSTIYRTYLSGIHTDLLNISKHESIIALAKALRGEEDIRLSERLSAVENLFNAFSQVKRVYAQARVLDSLGHERVRVDFDGDTTKIIRGPQLQDKSNRPYFKESMNLPPGYIYTSRLDLNMEHGKIENPHKPVMRFTTPIFVDGKRTGIVVLNLLANATFFLKKAAEKEEREGYILANQDGFYLHHPDEVKEWGMMESFNKSHHNIRQDYPDVAEQILSGNEGVVRLVSGRVIIYKPVYLDSNFDTDKFWIIIKRVRGVEYSVSASAWFAAATKAINTGLAISNIAGEEANVVMLEMESAARRKMHISYIIIGSSVFIFIFFIRWSRNRVLKPIQKLTGVTQKIAKGDFSFKAEVKSGDEIGVLATNFNKMADELTKEINERKRAEKEIIKEKKHTENLIETAQDAIICIDEKGIVSVWNKSAEKIFGYTSSEIIEQSIEMIIPEAYREGHNKGMERFLKTGKAKIIGKTVEVSGKTKEGIEIPIEMSLSFQKIEEEQYIFTGIIRDITLQKRTKEDLLNRTEELEHSNTELQQFVYVTSHDLRSPLVNIEGFSNELQHAVEHVNSVVNGNDFPSAIKEKLATSLEEDIPEALKYISTSTSKMQSLLSGLLQLSRIGRSELCTKQLDMNELISKVVGTFEYKIKDAGIILCVDELPSCRGDEDQINQVFSNLLDNALKYLDRSREGIIKISGRKDAGQVVYCTEDNGIGIAAEHQDKIYEMFHRLNHGNVDGDGLGLTIIYRILKRHGGKVWVESEPAKGSKFFVSLPG